MDSNDHYLAAGIRLLAQRAMAEAAAGDADRPSVSVRSTQPLPPSIGSRAPLLSPTPSLAGPRSISELLNQTQLPSLPQAQTALSGESNAGQVNEASAGADAEKLMLETEKAATLQKLQDLQRRIADKEALSRCSNLSLQSVQQENQELRTHLSEHQEALRRYHQIIQDLQSSRQSQGQPELSAARLEVEKLSHERSQLSHALDQAKREVEEEREKRLRAETERDGNKKGQSVLAKNVHEMKLRHDELEEKLKLHEEGDRRERQRLEKKIETYESENKTLRRDIEVAQKELGMQKIRVTTAIREKESAVSKYRARENEYAKLSDKLNLSRLENEGLQARVNELLSQEQDAQKIVADRKRMKEELHKERSTSDRLRSERNVLKIQLESLRSKRLARSATSTSELDLRSLRYTSRGGTEASEGAGGSMLGTGAGAGARDKVEPLKKEKEAPTSSAGDKRERVINERVDNLKKTGRGATLQVVGDSDDDDLPAQRIKLDDDSEQAGGGFEQDKGDEGDSKYDYRLSPVPSIAAIAERHKSPGQYLTMDSIPLEPVRAPQTLSSSLLGPESHGRASKRASAERHTEAGKMVRVMDDELELEPEPERERSKDDQDQAAEAELSKVDQEALLKKQEERRATLQAIKAMMREAEREKEKERNNKAKVKLDPFADIGDAFGLSLPTRTGTGMKRATNSLSESSDAVHGHGHEQGDGLLGESAKEQLLE